MTSTMHDALKRMSVIREGFVVRNLDGTHKTDDQADKGDPSLSGPRHPSPFPDPPAGEHSFARRICRGTGARPARVT